MKKTMNLLKNVAGLFVLAVIWVLYAPVAVFRALTDIGELQDFAEELFNAIGNLRFNASKAFRRRSTHNAVINECMRNLQNMEALKDAPKCQPWSVIHKFLKEQYK